MFWTASRMLCGTSGLAGRPSGQHIYHMLHELDQWFINPDDPDFVEPPVHHPHLQNLSIYPAAHLDRRQIDDYFYTIKAKLSLYLTSLHDEDLLQRPENCTWTRFTLILAQFRHWHLHLGMLMGFVQADTGLCPRTLPPSTDIPTGRMIHMNSAVILWAAPHNSRLTA